MAVSGARAKASPRKQDVSLEDGIEVLRALRIEIAGIDPEEVAQLPALGFHRINPYGS
jgi:hypothetical protein